MISRSWNYREGKTRGNAFCDGLIWASGPWLCYCCHKIRYTLEGRPWLKPPMYFAVATHKGHWVWPSKGST